MPRLYHMYRGIRPCAGCGMLIDIGNFCKPCKNLEKRIIKAGGPEAYARKHIKPIKKTRKRFDPSIATEQTSPPLNILHRPRRKTRG
jgi:hypothetical protein